MVKISKNGVVRNQTERSMFERLHHSVDEFRHSHSFMHRNTANARAALARWTQEGVLESRQERYSQYSSYTHTVYRLAAPWHDPDLLDANIVAEDAALTQQEAMNVNRLHVTDDELTAAWSNLRRLAADTTQVADGDLERVQDIITAANNAVIRRKHAVTTRGELAEQRAAIDARLALRPAVTTGKEDEADLVGAVADAMSDPLGGDA